MKTARIHITGASGAGVTTLGRQLAIRLACPHHDTDDYYWLPTNPPFREKRVATDRLRLVDEMFAGRPAWILSGSLDGWGDPLIPMFDLVVFLYTTTKIRLERLRARESLRYGAERPSAESDEFLEWAAHYDDGSLPGRSLARHDAWLSRLPCHVLRLDGALPSVVLVDEVVRKLTL
jgi:adenylate kinase family enzyme